MKTNTQRIIQGIVTLVTILFIFISVYYVATPFSPFKKIGETKTEVIDGKVYQVEYYEPQLGQKGQSEASSTTIPQTK